MEYIPWFAWIAIIGALVWGVVQIVGMATSRTNNRGIQEQQQQRLEVLEHRVHSLEQAQRSAR